MVIVKAAKTFKRTWVVLTLIKGFSRLETFLIKGNAQPVGTSEIASRCRDCQWKKLCLVKLFRWDLYSILVDGC